MRRFRRWLSLLAPGIFGATCLVASFTWYRHDRLHPLASDDDPPLAFRWAFDSVVLVVGLVLLALTVYAFTKRSPAHFKFTFVPSAPEWVGLIVIFAIDAFFLLGLLAAVRGLIYSP